MRKERTVAELDRLCTYAWGRYLTACAIRDHTPDPHSRTWAMLHLWCASSARCYSLIWYPGNNLKVIRV